jgi:hypothetical protein
MADMQFTMGGPERAENGPGYRPLMGTPPRDEAQMLCAASPEAELPSLHGFLWAVAWVVATILLVAQCAIDA